MAYWLFKTEPSEFSIDDLEIAPNKTTRWNGIRNYQARNFIRDQITLGDLVLIYHSQCKPVCIVGTAEVITASYADPDQFDQTSAYYDGKSTFDKPRWYCLDIQLKEKFLFPVTLETIKGCIELSDMVLLKQGRLSIQPVRDSEYFFIQTLAKSGR